MATHSSILARKSHGQRSLVGYSLWGCKEVVATETNTFIFYLFLNIYLVALGVSYIMWDLFSCGMWDLVPRWGIKSLPPALGAQSLSHWTTREVQTFILLFSAVQSLSRVQLFLTPWTTARQASLSITNAQSLLKLMSIESVMPSNHLILCRPLLLPPAIFPSIRVSSNESVLCIRCPEYWAVSASVLPTNIQDWFPLGWTGWISLQSKRLSRVFSNTIVQKHQFFSSQLSL